MPQVKKGDRVKIHYTLRLKDGTVAESTVGRDPLVFTVGKGKVIKGFENAVVGMAPFQTKTVSVKPAQGYGPADPSLEVTLASGDLPGGVAPQVGQERTVTLADGRSAALRVVKVEGDRVTLDGNYPLAGKELTFEIKLLAIG
jgi:peptidylprolyl isomerase